MNTHDHDNDALPGDDELKSLYRSLPRKEPAPALDSAIKRAAADAVRPQPAIPRWPVAVASVAVIVVAGALGWRVAQQPSAALQTPASPVIAQQALPAPAATPAMPSLAQAPVAATSEPRHDNIRTAMKAKVMAPAVASRQAPAVVAEPAPAMMMNSAAPAAESYAAQADRSNRAAPTTPMMAMKATALSAAAPQRDATAPSATDSPEQELAKIRELFALQRHDEAVQRLAAFHKAHPDVMLPDDLRTQLTDHE